MADRKRHGLHACGGAGIYYIPVSDITSLAIDVTKKNVARNLLLQDIDAVQSRMDHPQRPILKYIIGLLMWVLMRKICPNKSFTNCAIFPGAAQVRSDNSSPT